MLTFQPIEMHREAVYGSTVFSNANVSSVYFTLHTSFILKVNWYLKSV